MRKIDAGVGIFFALFGAAVLTQALRLSFFQRNGIPGPGFFPTVLAVAMIVLGVLLAVSRLRDRSAQRGDFALPGRPEAGRALGVWAAIAVSVALLPLAGFFVAMLVLSAVLLLGIERLFHWRAVLTIVAVPAVFYLLFARVLDVRLPGGLLGL